MTNSEEGIDSFRWGPDGTRIAFTRTDPKPDSLEQREERYDDYAVEDRFRRMTHLWVDWRAR